MEGGSLWTVLHNRGGNPLDWTLERRLRIIRDVASGMLYLHARGIVHRDIKSQNILLTEPSNGTAKLADFGVARIRNMTATLTSSSNRGRLLGTLAYIAPEALAGRVTGEDGWEKADMYSFAILCSEILTGRIPYLEEGWDENELRRHVGEGRRPNLSSGDGPEHVIDLVERAWGTGPEARPSFSEFLEGLDGLTGQATTGIHTPGNRLQPRQCMICQEKPRDAKLRPCNHAIACYDCCLEIPPTADGRQLCPYCRQQFTEISRGNEFYNTYCPE